MNDPEPQRRPGWIAFVPVGAFAVIAALFFYSLQAGDPSRLPSALLGKPVPDISLPGIEGLRTVDGASVPGFAAEDFSSSPVTVVNVWASWCVPCVREHPFLVVLSQMPGVQLFGVNYKDKTVAARRFLGRFGNPFRRVGFDEDGRGSVEWGLTGVPETFVVTQTGRVTFKYVGEITQVTMDKILSPEIAKARALSERSPD
ncbi:MAG: DsbE family thiol:disulfide interchange protein [Pseudomonadota bacterium]